jgi:hypothetical protein
MDAPSSEPLVMAMWRLLRRGAWVAIDGRAI